MVGTLGTKGLGMLGIDKTDNLANSGYITEDQETDIDIELVYSVRTTAISAIERSIIQVIMAMSK